MMRARPAQFRRRRKGFTAEDTYQQVPANLLNTQAPDQQDLGAGGIPDGKDVLREDDLVNTEVGVVIEIEVSGDIEEDGTLSTKAIRGEGLRTVFRGRRRNKLWGRSRDMISDNGLKITSSYSIKGKRRVYGGHHLRGSGRQRGRNTRHDRNVLGRFESGGLKPKLWGNFG
jgi:hypothetical protein